MTGTVLAIERCSLHDGPGLRTTVFLKGCALSCLWCHNPESQSFKPELYYFDEKCNRCGLCRTICNNHYINEQEHLINRKDCRACGECTTCPQSAIEIKGKKMSAQDVIDVVLKDVKYYEQSGGGMTISGGEALAQFDFCLELLRLAKENGIHTCIETSGHAPTERFLSIVQYVDLFLFDYKESDNDKHKQFTGVTQELILDNLLTIDKKKASIVLRCPVIPGYNDRDDHFMAIAKTASILNNIVEINVMPYHPMASSKATRIGKVYPMEDIGFPTDEQIDGWLDMLRRNTDVTVKKG